MAELTPHPENVPGDFYVVDGCCTMCEVPIIMAADLFGTVLDPKGYTHCHVRKQPASPAELDRMVQAIRCAELRCIRYRGTDRLIQVRLVEIDEGLVCDGLPPDLKLEAERREAERPSWSLEHPQEQLDTLDPPPNTDRPWWQFW